MTINEFIGLFLGLIVPMGLLIAPIFLLVRLGKSKKIDRNDYIGLSISTIIFGLINPVLAMYISMYGLTLNYNSDDPICLTGTGIFIFFGYIIGLIGIPITAIVNCPQRIRSPNKKYAP